MLRAMKPDTQRNMKRNMYALLLAAGMLLACALSAPGARAGDAAAERYVAELVSRAVAILDDEETPEDERREAFGALLVENVDMRRLPAFLLGQYARLPDDAQKQEYLRLLQEFTTRIYFVRLQEYAGDSIEITGSRDKNDGREVVVTGTIRLRDRDKPLSLDWWLLRRPSADGGADSFHVFDVRVAGIWLAQEQRSGFVSVIRNNQGSFDALLSHLRRQIDARAAAGAP